MVETSHIPSISKRNHWLLPAIVLSQFAGTSLWFTGNAILPELQAALGLSQYALSLVSTAVMLGFVTGTLMFSLLALADRFSPVKIFLISALAGAGSNLCVAWFATDTLSLFTLRFVTGFCIAGIYPVGMKIAADWYDKKLGTALGYLLGALVLGTAFPHLLKNRDFGLPWKAVLYATSAFAVLGGLLMFWMVGDGPYRKKSGSFEWKALPEIFGSQTWRRVAYGYWGHMWELYSFWGFLPVMLALYARQHQVALNVLLLSFLIIASGAISSVVGGYASLRFGSDKVAMTGLAISGACALLSPLGYFLPLPLFLAMLWIWGLTVNIDSPQFSTMAAYYAPAHYRGTALAIYNAIGFSITTISLNVMDRIHHSDTLFGGSNSFAILALGAVFGLSHMYRFRKNIQKTA